MLACCALACSDMKGIRDIKLSSYEITGCHLDGLRSVVIDVNLGIDNPAGEFTLEDISGNIYHKDKLFAVFSSADLSVGKKCNNVYPVSLKATLDSGVSLMDVLSLAGSFDLAGMSMDLSDFFVDARATAKLRKGRIIRQVALEKTAVTSLIPAK